MQRGGSSEEDVMADMFEDSGERVQLLAAKHKDRNGGVAITECTDRKGLWHSDLQADRL